MDDAIRKDLLTNLDTIVKAGEPSVDPSMLKKVKSICKTGNCYVEAAHHFLLSMLNEDHSQIRLSAMQVCHELFLRSSTFRDLVLENFKDFVELVVPVNSSKPLPPPQDAAEALNTYSLKSIKEWNSKFANLYVRLRVGFSYLLRTKKRQFEAIEAREAAQARHRAFVTAQEEARRQRELETATAELSATATEIENCGTEFDALCDLLIPEPDDFLIRELNEFADSEEKVADKDGFLGEAAEPERFKYRSHGFANNFSLEIDVRAPGRLVQNEDNADILAQLTDHRKSFEKTYLPRLKQWTRIFSKSEPEGDRLKRCHHLRDLIVSRLEKLNSMKVCGDVNVPDDLDDSDSDMEDVPEKEHYEADVRDLPTTSRVPRVAVVKPSMSEPRRSSTELQPSSADLQPATTVKSEEIKSEPVGDDEPGGSRTSSGQAPNVHFDIDLINWGQETSGTVILRDESLHRFWKGSEGEEIKISKSQIESLTKRRTVMFSGEFQPVTHRCRAPLPSGALCQRMDRRKCPFHGPIIPRDESGQPVSETDRARIEAEQELANAVSRRQKVLEERRAKRATKLVNLKKIKNNAKQRITKRVMNKAAMNRVAKVMNAIDSRKRNEKFGGLFHYSLKNSRL